MTLVETFKRQKLIEEGPKFLGTDDFDTERAVLFHVPMGKGKTTQIRGILERGERPLILTHRTTLTNRHPRESQEHDAAQALRPRLSVSRNQGIDGRGQPAYLPT
jgi:hypothetical protein